MKNLEIFWQPKKGEQEMIIQPKCYSYLRFSTPEQAKGDSSRRQLQLAEDYTSKHGLELDDTLRLQDMGLSAFHGHHRLKGDLGVFLRLVEEGKIARGSVLLVENLDRLSREQVLNAFTQFTAIVKAGIKVVTLMDNMEYTEKSLNDNMGQLLFSLVDIAKAHKESRDKSDRGKKNWEGKREEARKRKKRLTKKCPLWLQPQEDGDWFDPIDDRCESIEKIFMKYDSGKGKRIIEREMNQGEDWKPDNGWRKSYIDKILRNRAVIGEFQPKRWEDVEGKRERVPVGEPITDYYPRVISEELFNRVQDRLDKNINHGGKTGKINNLFSHRAKCGYCGGPMRFENKGKPPKGGKHLICDNAVRGLGCTRFPVRYDHFEKLILTYCKGLNVDDILKDGEVESELNQLHRELATVTGALAQIGSKIKNVTDSVENTKSRKVREHLEKTLDELLEQQARLESQKNNIQGAIDKLSKAEKTIQEQLRSINELWDFMQSAPAEELIVVRSRLRDKLRRLIRRIRVFPVYLPIIAPAKAKRLMDKARKAKRLTHEQKLMVSLIKGSQRVEIQFEREGFRFLMATDLPSRAKILDFPARESYNTGPEGWMYKEAEGKTFIKVMRN